MSKFVEHIVRDGDTMQAIAQEKLGDMSLWTELVSFNDLRYPYIVDTLEEKMENPDHLVTIGDTILMRVDDDVQSTLIQELKRSSEYSQAELYALALGKDLDILPLPKGMTDPGQDAEILELKGDNKGGIATVRGVDNLKQSLFVRLITPQGSYIGHPLYGSRIHLYLGKKNTEENASLIDIEIERAIRTDTRVTTCKLVNRRIIGNTYAAEFKVSSITLEDAFDFVVSADQGTVVLLDSFNDLVT